MMFIRELRMYKHIVFPLLCHLSKNDAETAHVLALRILHLAENRPPFLEVLRYLYRVRSTKLETEVFGIRFPSPVGLAAGFSKNAEVLLALEALGFGFIEVGSVLPGCGQPGNPRPRLFRLPKDRALINRMGFNSRGVEYIKPCLQAYRKEVSVPIGINIGKLKKTPNKRAWVDYVNVFSELYDVGDYFVINVSSPNTPGLRSLQTYASLETLLLSLRTARDAREKSMKMQGVPRKPILVKVSPDLSWPEYDTVLAAVEDMAEGLVCANTTTGREGLLTATDEEGGLSGQPLLERALDMVAYARKQGFPHPIIGVGGVSGYESFRRMQDVGADLVQIFTGFVYEGPGLLKRINQGILNPLT